MRLCSRVLALIVSFFGPSGSTADDKILNLGDPAPPLAVSEWIKGEKVERFDPGKIYVIDFWATWCAPCRASIPHLSELANRYKDRGVRFIGVDVWEREQKLVRRFVDRMGGKMSYSVAIDSVTEKGDPGNGAMVKTWMRAADENGIPTVFVVHNAKIAWIGHPTELDGPLSKIVAGDWDTKAMRKDRLATMALQRKYAAVVEKVMKPFRAGDYDGASPPSKSSHQVTRLWRRSLPGPNSWRFATDAIPSVGSNSAASFWNRTTISRWS